jgi:hypothetical protein
MPDLSTQSLLARNSLLFASPVDKELVMMDENRGLYFGLNAVARRIWEMLEAPVPYGELVSLLCEIYSVKREQCERDLGEFLQTMIQHGLIEVRA